MGTLITLAVVLAVLVGFALAGKHFGLFGSDRPDAPTQEEASDKGASLCRASGPLLTPAERTFFAALRAAAGTKLLVFAKVRMADLVCVPGGGSRVQSARNRIVQKHADFVLCDPVTTKTVLVIELDDRSHDRPDRKERDDFVDAAYRAAAVQIMHKPAAGSYSPEQLRQEIEAALGAKPAQQREPTPVATP